MGHGSYTASDWNMLRSSFSAAKKAEDIFISGTQQTVKASLSGVYREARDNEDSPFSTPVIIGLDVTASMGYLAQELAAHALNRAIMYLYENKPIPCPQVLCCAIGDSKSDRVPFQVTQFESDIRIIKQLTGLYLEGGGGGKGDAPGAAGRGGVGGGEVGEPEGFRGGGHLRQKEGRKTARMV